MLSPETSPARSSWPTPTFALTEVLRVCIARTPGVRYWKLTRWTGNWKDMANIYLNTCVEGAESQTWVVMNDGRIPLAASKPRKWQKGAFFYNVPSLTHFIEECIDLQYMRATANNPVGFYSCAGLGNTGAADKGINWPLIAATP